MRLISKLKIVTGEQYKGEAAFCCLTWKHAKLGVFPQEQRKEGTACSPGSQTGALGCYSFLFILTGTSTAGYKSRVRVYRIQQIQVCGMGCPLNCNSNKTIVFLLKRQNFARQYEELLISKSTYFSRLHFELQLNANFSNSHISKLIELKQMQT